MKIGIFGKSFGENFNTSIIELFQKLSENGISLCIFKPLKEFLDKEVGIKPKYENVFSKPEEIYPDIDIIISIGGDGTFLEAVSLIRDKEIPIMGINSGRLGFLANISKKDILSSIDSIINKEYTIENRALLKIENSNGDIFDFPYALNELTVLKSESSSMIKIKAYINGEYLNSYWADGLIISTPTGSTAYTLSAGGPIVMPNSNNFIITPIAPHTLTIRPLVISDDNIIKLKVESRSGNYMASIDYNSAIIDDDIELTISKAEYTAKIIKLNNQSYFSTLRTKLMWGRDKRN